MRTRYRPVNRRRVLCVYPEYARSFGTFQHAYPLFGGRVRAFMPPQGLLVAAAYLPETWDVRFVDENSRRATDEDFRWADAVLTSGMHVQRARIRDLIARAHAHGRAVVLGGPSVSSCPEDYPDADVLHLGELGDATDEVIEYLDGHADRPAGQLRFETGERLALVDFPRGTGARRQTDDAFAAAGLPHTVRFEVNLMELVERFVRHGLAVGIVPALIAEGFQGVVQIPLQPTPTRRVHLVWQRLPTPAARAFVEAVLSRAGAGSGP